MYLRRIGFNRHIPKPKTYTAGPMIQSSPGELLCVAAVRRTRTYRPGFVLHPIPSLR